MCRRAHRPFQTITILEAAFKQKYKYIKDGTVTVSTAAPWNTLMYLAMDTIARIFAGHPTTADQNWVHPEWFVTAQNVPSITSYFGVVPDSVNDADFKKLWGV